jgi:hypothetical protein
MNSSNATAGDTPYPQPAETIPANVLNLFISVFKSKGWLNRNIRILHCSRRYLINCTDQEFYVYRINDNCGISPGIPGWPVCIVKPDKIINDSEMCTFASTELSARDWLRCLTDNDFELI